MSNNKIIIKSMNKKIIAGTLTLTLLTFGLSGCTSIKDIEYRRNEQGYVDGIESNVSYKFLKKCSFCKIENKITEETYYTIVYNASDYRWVEGYDIFTGQNLFEGSYKLEIIDSVKKWLNNLNMIKDEYTEEELKELLNIFIEKQEKNKQLVKE